MRRSFAPDKELVGYQELPNRQRYAQSVAEGVYASTKSYHDWLIGDQQLTLELLTKWVTGVASEYGCDTITVVRSDDDRIIGGYRWIPVAKQQKRRFADLRELRALEKTHGLVGIRERLSLLSSLFPPMPDSNGAIFNTLWVDPSLRSKSIGRLMLFYALSEMATQGFEETYGFVDSDNKRAIRFHEAQGEALVGPPIVGGPLVFRPVTYFPRRWVERHGKPSG